MCASAQLIEIKLHGRGAAWNAFDGKLIGTTVLQNKLENKLKIKFIWFLHYCEL
jgi:hypothetical protein